MSMKEYKQGVGQRGWHVGYMCISIRLHKPSNKLGEMCNNLLKVIYFKEGD